MEHFTSCPVSGQFTEGVSARRRCPQFVSRRFAHPPRGQYHELAMGFSETIFLFFLALLVFGPKRLPEIARQVGKMMNELKRASNEFRSQIESEISNLELEKTRQILPSTQPSGTIENSPKTIEAT